MKTRKRLSHETNSDPKRLQICKQSDYSIENLSSNLQPFPGTTLEKSRVILIDAFMYMKQGIWFTILPTKEENLDISSDLEQESQQFLKLFLHLGLIRLRIENSNTIYNISKPEWDSFIYLLP